MKEREDIDLVFAECGLTVVQVIRRRDNDGILRDLVLASDGKIYVLEEEGEPA